MNSPLSQSPEPIVSLPIGVAILGLLLIVGVASIFALLLTQRRHRAHPDRTTVGDAPWLRALLDGLPQAALIVDPNGRPVTWNALAAHSLSLTDGTVGLPLSLTGPMTRVLRNGTAETTEVPDPNVPGRRLRVTASPLSKNEEDGALILVRDLADQSAVAHRRLISAVAHELRTPLTAILGHAEILGSCQPEEETLWRRSRDFIASEAERLARLVEDLLTLSRLDLTPLRRRAVNLRAVVEEAISSLFQAAEENKVRLVLQSPPNLPRILGDRDRLYQVFLNLLDNAVKYSVPGGEAVVRLALEADHVEVEVRDDGAGISPEDLPHVFEPMFRSEGVRYAPGTGLGLTIVRTILEQHGTSIGVQSVSGRGTTFHFRLPRAQSDRGGELDSPPT